MRTKLISVLIVFVAVAAVVGYFGGCAESGKKVEYYSVSSEPFGGKGKIYEDILTISVADGRDSTAVLDGYRYFTLSILPGKTSSSPDSVHSEGDSTVCDFYIRGWSDESRTQCLGAVQVFNPYQMLVAATASNADSATKSVIFASDQYSVSGVSAISDSTLLNDLKNHSVPELWPFVDVLAYDADTKTGKSAYYKIKLIGYND
jgi:hypothetical protein